jgi:hypothetical protein
VRPHSLYPKYRTLHAVQSAGAPLSTARPSLRCAKNAVAALRPVGGLPTGTERNAILPEAWQFVGNVIDDVTNSNSTATSDSDAQRNLNTTALELVMHAHASRTWHGRIGFVAACRW